MPARGAGRETADPHICPIHRKAAYNFAFAIILLIAFFAFLVYFLSSWALRAFGTLTFRMVLFNIMMPMQGAESSHVSDAITQAIVPSVLITVAFAGLVALISRARRKTRLRCSFVPRLTDLVPGLALTLAVLMASASIANNRFDIVAFVRDQRIQSPFIAENYVEPARTQLTFPEKKRNLIHIMLESMETAYMDEGWGGLSVENHIPELTSMAAANVSFSNSNLLGGFLTTMNTNWTIAGMFSQSAGLPLTLPIDGNSMSEYVKFFPGVTSLGDILEDAGYENVLMLGSDSVFGGRRQYYTQHGNYRIIDYESARATGMIPPDYHVWWGFEDARLYDFAKQELLKLSIGDQPFNLTLLTADTHFEDGYVCNLCQNETDNQYANVLACASRQAADFVQWIKEQDFYENTTIVVTGDHITMDKDFFEVAYSDDSRPIYNTFINAVPVEGINSTLQKNRLFTPFDIFPTTLSALGVQIEGNRLALGTNLFSGLPTLAEQYGMTPLNIALSQRSTFFENKLFYGR